MITNKFMESILFFSIIFFLGCNKTSQGSPPPIPMVSLSASPSSITVGDSFELSVTVDNIDDLDYIAFEIFFDPDYLEVDMEFADFIFDPVTGENFDGPVTFLDTLGVLSFLLGDENINGEIFSNIIITGVQSGTTDMELNPLILFQENTMNDGTIVVDDVSNRDYITFKDVTITVTD